MKFTEENQFYEIRTCVDTRELIKSDIEPDSLYTENMEAIMIPNQKYRFVDYGIFRTIENHVKNIVGSSLFDVAFMTFEITLEMEKTGIAMDEPVSDYDTALDIFKRKLYSGVFDKTEVENAINAVERIYNLADNICGIKNQDEKKQIYLEILEIFNSSFKLIDEWSFNIEVSHGFSEFYNKICNKLEKLFDADYILKIKGIAEKAKFDDNDKEMILNLLMELSKSDHKFEEKDN